MSRPAISAFAPAGADIGLDQAPAPAVPAPSSPECGAGADPAAWADLLLRTFNEVRDELVSTLWYVVGNSDDAQDMAQEVFLRCWRTRDGLPDVRNMRAWIFRVGLNAAKDLHRSAWRRRVKTSQGAEIMPRLTETPATCELEARESLDQLRDALMHLRPEEKEVFLLRQNGEMTYEQIAEVSQRPVGTVKTQMRSALQKLRKVLA